MKLFYFIEEQNPEICRVIVDGMSPKRKKKVNLRSNGKAHRIIIEFFIRKADQSMGGFKS